MSVKTVTVNKFLGLNQSPNGSTGLALGEASVAENFYITDDYKLKTRPGVSILNQYQKGGTFKALWNGLLGDSRWTLIIYQDGHDEQLTMTAKARNAAAQAAGNDGDYTLNLHYLHPVKVFSYGDSVWIVGADVYDTSCPRIYRLTAAGDGGFTLESSRGYYPLVSSGNSAGGGGTTLEPLNLLADHFRIQFSADGESTEYHLPSMASAVDKVLVDGVAVTDGDYNSTHHIYTFSDPPVNGVNNIEFVCFYRDPDRTAAVEKFLKMRHTEAYNGSTDSRMFFYGDGTNICYYTGVPTYGEGLYLPAGYEIAVDSSASAITGMRRHYTRLMAYKADGTFSINYEPVTLADGTVTAGFYVHPASRDVGNDMDNQIQTVGNFPRTLCGGSLFEWRHTASYYQDERYAKRIGQQVSLYLQDADPSKIVTCDDDASRTYYMFLNDGYGTVLVNRYELDVWTVYTGSVFDGVRYADGFHGDLLFANDNTVFYFDPSSAFDAVYGGRQLPIPCRWESGFMSFGADYLRKYSSTLWVSMLPEVSSNMEITVQTDRRDEYMTKTAGRPLLDFGAVDFSHFSFLISRAPKIQRIKLKVKKFVYYKLIFRVDSPGARATVLGYDQQIRYASYVK